MDLTPKEKAFLVEVLETWIPSTPSGKVTKAQDKLIDKILTKLQK